MVSEHTSAARMVPDHLTWGEYATVTTAPGQFGGCEGILAAVPKIFTGRTSTSKRRRVDSIPQHNSDEVDDCRRDRATLRAPSPAQSIFSGGQPLALEAYCGADRKRESSASRSRLRTPSTRSPLTTQVGYALTSICLHRSGRGLIPLGSHSTYGSSFAADPNRAFCSLQAGHQYAPYMIAPTCLR
jgi:hypothetical protein